MNAMKTFTEQLDVLVKAKLQLSENAVIWHGIVHLFMDVFDAGQEALRDYMQQHQLDESAKGTPKELLMDAYERIVAVPEETWLHMLQDRYHPDHTEPVCQKAERVCCEYIPAFVALRNFMTAPVYSRK